MSKKRRYFQKLYKYDKISNSYLIEVSLDDYDDVFDDWDPSPFKKRDIEDEFDDFIVNSSEDIPLSHNISIVLYLPKSKKNTRKEATLKAAYKNFYEYIIEKIHKDIRTTNKTTISYLFLSLGLLSIGYMLFKGEQNLIFNVLQEGVLIGGWVFLWEFFTNIFIKMRELHNMNKLYNRLYNAEIRFTYVDD
jgi:hypothetical protein